MAPHRQDPRARPWATLRLALHEARSPLTVVAYASELLLESSRPPEPRVARQHLEAIHRASQEAAACISLISRCIEVEHAGTDPRPEPVPVEDFRDPNPSDGSPAIAHGMVVHADPRLVRNLAAALWELASLFPRPRAQVVSAVLVHGHLSLQLRGPEAFLHCLDPEPTQGHASPRRPTDPIVPFAARFRAEILLRALALLGGRVVPSDAPGSASDLVLLIPDNTPAPRRRKNPR